MKRTAGNPYNTSRRTSDPLKHRSDFDKAPAGAKAPIPEAIKQTLYNPTLRLQESYLNLDHAEPLNH